MKRWIPLGLFAALAVLLGVGLGIDPKRVPSPLIGKPVPTFDLERLYVDNGRVSDADLRGQVTLVNVWGTWCSGCREEHEPLLRLARRGLAPIIGLNWKDDRALAIQWLRELGNPYAMSGFDKDGRVAIEWGVYGAPETFVVDRKGIVRHKHIGPLNDQIVQRDILPLLRQLREET